VSSRGPSFNLQFRTKIFGYFSSAGQVIQLLSPALASVTMSWNLWVPFWIGISTFIGAIPAVALLPDTRRQAQPADSDQSSEVDHLDEERQPILDTSSREPPASKRKTLRTILRASVSRLKSEYRDFGHLLTSSRNVGLCLAVFLVTTFAKANTNVLLQYVSKRYDWTIAQAAYLFSLKAGVNLVLYVLIVPQGLKHLESQLGYTKVAANLWAAKASLLLLCIGVTFTALSSEIWMLFISKPPRPLFLPLPISSPMTTVHVKQAHNLQVSWSTPSAGAFPSSCSLSSLTSPSRSSMTSTPHGSTAP
jgi:hypothetical protein